MRTSIFFTVIVLVLAGFNSFGVAADEGSWTGWISDARCAADYAKSATADHVGCAKICIKNGGQWALSLRAPRLSSIWGTKLWSKASWTRQVIPLRSAQSPCPTDSSWVEFRNSGSAIL